MMERLTRNGTVCVAEVGRVVLVIAAVLGGTLLTVLWFLPVQVRAHFHQEASQARLFLQLRAPLLELTESLSLTDVVETAVDHMLKRWRAKGEPVRVPLQQSIRRLPQRKFARVLTRPMRFLGRRARCCHLEVLAEVGGRDAMESALLAGASWTVAGQGIGLLSSFVQVEPKVPRVRVIPNFSTPTWRLDADCILRIRLGHAIVTGLWLLRRIMREKEIFAWVRDSLRRKGEEPGERTSNTGPNEDGHGKS